MANYGTASVDGVRLETGTLSEAVHIMGEVVDLDVPVSAQVFALPFRESEVIVRSKRHLHRGTITGTIETWNEDGTAGTGLTAKQWAERLFLLIKNQGSETISLSSRDFQATSVKFPGDYSIQLQRSPVPYYRVTLPFIEVS